MIGVFAYTSQGGREYNEDFVGCVDTADGAVAVLCDGVSGVSGGEIASRIIVDTVIDEPYDGEDPAAWLSERLYRADARVREEQTRLQNRMESTVVTLRISGDCAAWAHAGDSRLYYLHDGRIAEATVDHSLAFQKYMEGKIPRSAIATDPDKNRMYRSVGGEGGFAPEIGGATVSAGDAFVLCSDGAWENLLDQEIAFDYHKAATCEQWAYLLLLRIVDRMQNDGDNLSIITVMIS